MSGRAWLCFSVNNSESMKSGTQEDESSLIVNLSSGRGRRRREKRSKVSPLAKSSPLELSL